MIRAAQRLRRDEGATLVIVALALVAIMGMVVLTVDVGGLLLRRREMVNAADASALATAQSCASTPYAGDAESVADHYAVENSYGLTASDGGIDWTRTTRTCGTGGSGHVTVTYTVNQTLYFASVLGFENPQPVRTEATASWGAAMSTYGSNPPLVINEGAFQGNCVIPTATPGTTCYLWFDNNLFSGSAFGFLNLCPIQTGCGGGAPWGWDVPASYGCPSDSAHTLSGWTNGSISVNTLSVNYPSPTYVCADGGIRGNIQGSVWNDVSGLVGQTRDFPINDPTGQISKTGPQGIIQVDKYDIVGWATLYIKALDDIHSTGGSSGTCAVKTSKAFNKQATPYAWSVFGNSSGCPGTVVPDLVGNVSFTLPNGSAMVQGTDYTYTNTGFTLKTTLPKGSSVSFDWSKGGTCGGVAPPNASARCLTVVYNGARIVDGNIPTQGQAFGRYVIKLCDLKIQGSCTG